MKEEQREELLSKMKKFKEEIEKKALKIPPDMHEKNIDFIKSCLTSFNPEEAADYVSRNLKFVNDFVTEKADSLQEAFLLGFLTAMGMNAKISLLREYEEQLMGELMMDRLKNLFGGLVPDAPFDNGPHGAN